jgi:hypothetical protein
LTFYLFYLTLIIELQKMSEFILKFWPINEITEDHTELLIFKMKDEKIITDEMKNHGIQTFKPGENLGEMIGMPYPNYISNLIVQIEFDGYGVLDGEEEFEYVDRKNVISILNGDGEIESWSNFEEFLSKITGTQYKGGWDLL